MIIQTKPVTDDEAATSLLIDARELARLLAVSLATLHRMKAAGQDSGRASSLCPRGGVRWRRSKRSNAGCPLPSGQAGCSTGRRGSHSPKTRTAGQDAEFASCLPFVFRDGIRCVRAAVCSLRWGEGFSGTSPAASHTIPSWTVLRCTRKITHAPIRFTPKIRNSSSPLIGLLRSWPTLVSECDELPENGSRVDPRAAGRDRRYQQPTRQVRREAVSSSSLG